MPVDAPVPGSFYHAHVPVVLGLYKEDLGRQDWMVGSGSRHFCMAPDEHPVRAHVTRE